MTDSTYVARLGSGQGLGLRGGGKGFAASLVTEDLVGAQRDQAVESATRNV